MACFRMLHCELQLAREDGTLSWRSTFGLEVFGLGRWGASCTTYMRANLPLPRLRQAIPPVRRHLGLPPLAVIPITRIDSDDAVPELLQLGRLI